MISLLGTFWLDPRLALGINCLVSCCQHVLSLDACPIGRVQSKEDPNNIILKKIFIKFPATCAA